MPDTVEFNAIELTRQRRHVAELFGAGERVTLRLPESGDIEVRLGRTIETPPCYVGRALGQYDDETPRFGIFQGELVPLYVELEYGKDHPTTLGRRATPNLMLGPDVSAEHCSVAVGRVRTPFGIELAAVIEDLGSTNGTEVIFSGGDFLFRHSHPPEWR